MRLMTILISMLLAFGLLRCHPPMWRAEGSARVDRVKRLVLVVHAKGCRCTRKDVAEAMRALTVVLGARRDRMVEQLDWDKNRARARAALRLRTRNGVWVPAATRRRAQPGDCGGRGGRGGPGALSVGAPGGRGPSARTGLGPARGPGAAARFAILPKGEVVVQGESFPEARQGPLSEDD